MLDSASASPLLALDGREKGDDAAWTTPIPTSSAVWTRREPSRPAGANVNRRWPHLLFGVLLGLALAVPLGSLHHASSFRHLWADVETCAASLAESVSRVESLQSSGMAWAWKPGQDDDYRKPLRRQKPRLHYRDNLYPERGYLTGLQYGGPSNEVMCTIAVIHLSVLTQRTPILTALVSGGHFEGGEPAPVSSQFDLAFLRRQLDYDVLEMHDLKPIGWLGQGNTSLGRPQVAEEMGCHDADNIQWRRDADPVAAWIYGIGVSRWPLVTRARLDAGDVLMDREANGFRYERMANWILDPTARRDALEERKKEIKAERRKQKAHGEELRPEGTEPDENMICLVNPFFTVAQPPRLPLVDDERGYDYAPDGHELLAGEDDSWIKVGRFLRFTERIESLTTDALRIMLDAADGDLPPFIAVHVRRGDFEDVRGLTEIDRYQKALARVERRLRRGDRALVPYRSTAPPEPPLHPSVPTRPGHAMFVPKHLRNLRVVCGTDETDATWINEVLVPALGCVYANHTALDTVAKYGSPWGPTVLDAAIFSRAQGFVGTADSTFSGLAALRVKYWNRGIVDHARAPYEEPVR